MRVKVVSRRRVSVPGRLPRPARLLVLLLTLWPTAFFTVVLIFWLGFALALVAPVAELRPTVPLPVGTVAAFFVGQFATILISFALLVGYLVHLSRNARIAGTMKAVWALVLLLGGIVAMPAYWYLYLWRADNLLAAPPAPDLAVADTATPARRPR